MSRDSDTRNFFSCHSLQAVAWLAATSLVGGCDPASTTTTTGRPGSSSTAAEQLEHSDDRAAEDSLLTQAQQDVEFFLKQRDSRPADVPPRSMPDGSDLSTARHQARTPQDAESIQWNDPVGAGAVRTGSTTGDMSALRRIDQPSRQAPEEISQPDVAGQPAVMNEPLYRDAAEETASTDALPGRSANDSAADAGDPLVVDRVQKLVVDLSGELYRNASRSDAPLRELMLIAATSLVTPDRAVNAHGIASLSERDRELLIQMQQFFAALGRDLGTSDNTEDTVRSAVAQLSQALDRTPPFTIAETALCMRVRGFGNYDAFDKASFLAHSQQKLIVYIELDNFTSTLNEQNQWLTELAQELVIYSSSDGIPVWSESWQSVVDVTRNRRQDFFTVQMVTLPDALSVGRYHLKVRIRDEQSGAIAERSIPFEMVADPRLAATVR